METALAVLTGIGLSAACGFRIFLPLLVLNLASMYGYIGVAPGFEWIAGTHATIAFGSATALEIAAYYVPWLDNAMDAIASPISVIAGVLVTASVVTGVPPSLKWILAIIAGGGVAGLLQGASAALRLKSSLFTGGIGNIVVATLELVGAAAMSLLAVALPIAGFVLAAALIVFLLAKAVRAFLKKRSPG